MKSAAPWAIAATLLLHAALASVALIGLSNDADRAAETPPMTVQLVQAPAEAPATPPAIVPAPVPAPTSTPTPSPAPEAAQRRAPETPRRPPKRAAPTKQPAPMKPEAGSPALTDSPSVPAQTASPPASAPAPSAAVAAASAPVKVPPSDASYAGRNRKPPYPAMSRRYGEEGTVVLRVLVQPDGSAGAVEIKSSSGFPMLDQAARSTVQSWRFRPATSNGNPVAEWYEIPIPFKLEN